jgi:HAMP domain-containing protein
LDWHWGTRTALALAILAGTVLAMERWVEDPVRRFLATSPLVRVRQT